MCICVYSPFEQFHLSLLSVFGLMAVVTVAAWVLFSCDDCHLVVVGLGAQLGARVTLTLMVVVGVIGAINLCGLIPYATVLTASLVGAMWMGVGVWVYRGLFGLLAGRGSGFRAMIGHWLIGPFGLAFLFVPLECIGFVMPLVSLGVRLFANIMAGHVLLHVFAGFTALAFSGSMIGGFGLALVLLCLVGLEGAVAGIQAYVFGLLFTVYVSDVVTSVAAFVRRGQSRAGLVHGYASGVTTLFPVGERL